MTLEIIEQKAVIEIVDCCSIVEAFESTSSVIEIIEKGAQGIQGEDGAQGIQGEAGDSGEVAISGTWIGLATGFKTTPVLNTTIASGDVYDYDYDGVTYYRLVPNPYVTVNDAFYETFDAGALSDLIVAREVIL